MKAMMKKGEGQRPIGAPPLGEKDQVMARVDRALLEDIKILAIRQRKRYNAIAEEAFRDVLKKYAISGSG